MDFSPAFVIYDHTSPAIYISFFICYKSLTALYPIIYNYSYILLEGVLTIVVISIPAVSRALGRMRIMATGGNRQSAATEK